MTRYERRVLAVDDDGGIAVEGRIIAVLDSPRAGVRQITALVEVAEKSTASAPATFQGDSEGVDKERLAEGYRKAGERSKQTWFCNEEKSNGEPCTREVDAPDDTCWQHPTDE